MKKTIARLFLPLISALTCATLVPLLGADTTNAPLSAPLAPKTPPFLSWIGPNGIDYVLKAVPPPPEAGSDLDKADLDAVLKAQATRSPADIKESMDDNKFSIDLIARVIGSDFTAENYPVTFSFLRHVREDESFLSSKLKAQYHRPRPFQAHPEVKNLFPAKEYSYPSSHAAGSRMLMLVLTELFSDKGTALLERDLAISQSRVNAGVHYPNDIIAGRALATALMFVLQDNPAFDHDMAAAKAEITAKQKAAAAQAAK